MFTINLNEIKLDPPIEEINKIFEGETKAAVIALALNYISLNYKDKYDPNVLELAIAQAVTEGQ